MFSEPKWASKRTKERASCELCFASSCATSILLSIDTLGFRFSFFRLCFCCQKASSHMGLSYMWIEFDIKSYFHFHPLSLFVSPIFARFVYFLFEKDNFPFLMPPSSHPQPYTHASNIIHRSICINIWIEWSFSVVSMWWRWPAANVFTTKHLLLWRNTNESTTQIESHVNMFPYDMRTLYSHNRSIVDSKGL